MLSISKLKLAEKMLEECIEKGVHCKYAAKFIEDKIKNEDEEVQYAIDIYLRYNLNDESLNDSDIDYARFFLKN